MSKEVKKVLESWYSLHIKILLEGIVVGVLVGLVIVLYRICLERALHFAKFIYKLQRDNYKLIILWLIFLIVGAYVIGRLMKREPMASGSGIPQIKGVLIGKLSMNPVNVLISKFIGGVVCIGAGLSLGREGPSIQIGAAIGQAFSQLFKKVKIEEKFLMTSGASAGLAAAFNAPLSGVIFALEEVHKNFSPKVMLYALSAAITGDFVAKIFLGIDPAFNFNVVQPIPLIYYGFLVILGIILGILGLVFNKSIVCFQDLYQKQKYLPREFYPIIPFLLAGFLGLVMPQVLGGGHELVEMLIHGSTPFHLLMILLVVKFLFTMISYGSSAPGGIFLPLLVIGALIGMIFFQAIHTFFGVDEAYLLNFIILAMAGYFTAIVSAPITGIILITEMTGSFSNLLSISIVCLVAYMTSSLINSQPIYDILLERLLKQNKTSSNAIDHQRKTLLEVPIILGSLLDGKKIKELDWPSQCLVISIRRGEKEIIPKGEELLLPGDCLIILTDEELGEDVKKQLGLENHE